MTTAEARMDEGQPSPGLTPEQRAAFRAFVRDHHPDRGGDPEVFKDGLARYRALAAGQHAAVPGPAGTHPDPGEDARYDAPIHIVPQLPLPTRVLVALIRTIRARSHPRVDRPGHPAGPDA